MYLIIPPQNTIIFIKIPTLDPPLDFISVVKIILPNAHHPSLCQCELFSGVGAEGHSSGFKQDTAAPHHGKNLGNPTLCGLSPLHCHIPYKELRKLH